MAVRPVWAPAGALYPAKPAQTSTVTVATVELTSLFMMVSFSMGDPRLGSVTSSLGSGGISRPPSRYQTGIGPIDRRRTRSHTREMRRLRVLGPLEVDDAGQALGPRDRV